MRSDLEDVEVELHHQTPSAVLVSRDGEEVNAVWVPKSQCELEHKRGSLWVLTAPVRVLIEKELV